MMAFERISETNEEMICGKIYENISLKVIYTEYCSVKVEKKRIRNLPSEDGSVLHSFTFMYPLAQ